MVPCPVAVRLIDQKRIVRLPLDAMNSFACICSNFRMLDFRIVKHAGERDLQL